MSAEENKAISRRFIEEIWSKGNLPVVDEIIAANFVRHDPADAAPVSGCEGIKQVVAMYRTAFPDLKFTVEEQIAEGDKVVTRWTSNATHQGELLGIPATGKKTSVTGIHIARLAGGKVVEEWNNWDTIGLMRQLGVISA